ncbi:very short patch repair endonuclease [Achromobacter denitrificans]|uniref:very short patch repair endonuclease n=1 Tax=Achromobacter denitrificans TaxID=32002 RepID=UPI000F678E26|nr:very short patch repair endonuclease [Achromobacter denitrificans]RSE90421.1 DNA mismatch endonuclease Vsr [Achromobacter denitrificans]
MPDVVSPEKRSRMMSGIKGKNSLPEMLVRKMLFAMGYRFRLHRRDLPGTPDIAMPGCKIAIFVHGCFWHMHRGCKYAKTPSTRLEFWTAKLRGNVERDQRAVGKLAEMGWRVLNVWECAMRDPEAAAALPEALRQWINSGVSFGEISAQSLAADAKSEAGGVL